jgi:hypothetical protein
MYSSSFGIKLTGFRGKKKTRPDRQGIIKLAWSLVPILIGNKQFSLNDFCGAAPVTDWPVLRITPDLRFEKN